ncbi:MAG: shikimate dehydrogenase [Akkermansiaceae bacterium]|nr:shikimate dehydrogenase [Akkermansiaceae bacterium]
MNYFTLDQLSEINSGHDHPAKFAVIGNPVAHSLSPQLHQPALNELKLDCRYIRVEVPEGQVNEAFEKMYAAGIRGINVTVPHKLEALEACHQVDPAASSMGAVNTIVFNTEGQRTGFNTDGPGFVRAIRQEFGMDLGDLRVIIIGAGGGAGRAIATQCALEGCPQLILANRTLEKLTPMREELTRLTQSEKLEGPRDRIEIHSLDDPILEDAIGASELIINTTSVGLKSSDPAPFPPHWVEPHHLVYDTIYNPSRTHLLRDAESQGARIANGLSLLLHQGALSLEHWLNQDAPVDAMRQGLLDFLKA